MRKLILLVALFCSFAASSQVLQFSRTYGYHFNRLLTDSAIGIPTDTFRVPPSYRTKPWLAGKAGTGNIYVWNTSTLRWEAISGSGGARGLTRVVAGSGLNQVNDSSFTVKKYIDVYLIGGQSNAVGNSGGGGAAASPDPDTATVYQYYNRVFSKVTDEVGSPNTGSAWPSFGITYYNMTGHKICFIPTAVNGTTQTAAADVGAGNWSTTGTWYGRSITAADSALQAIKDSGYTPIFRGILWCQGESDGNGINAASITQSDYSTALTTMIANYRTHFGPTMPFYIYRIATRVSASDVGFAAVRTAQEAVAAADPLKTKIVFRNSLDFPARSLFVDQYHYAQTGYNEMGRYSAEIIAASLSESWQKQEGNLNYYGKVGIGITRPTLPLQVYDASVAAKFTSSGAVGRVIDIENLSSSSTSGTGIRFYNDGGLAGQILNVSTTSAFGGNTMIIHSANSGNVRFGSNNGSLEIFSGAGGPTTTNIHTRMNNLGRWAFGYFNPSPDTSALIDMQSTLLGFLVPRMTTAQQNAIVLPATGLMIFNTDSVKHAYYNGSAWVCYGTSTGAGSGSGTVSSGTQYRLAYYATTGTTASEAAAITGTRALVSDANGVPTHSTTTATELGYVSGVTSSIQTQMNLKAPLASPTFTGTVTLPSGQTLVAPVLGTPASVTLTNGTGLPIPGITGLGTGVGTWLATPSSSNLASAVTGKTGSGALMFGTAPSATGATFTTTSVNGVTLDNTGLATQYLDKTGNYSTPAGSGGGVTTVATINTATSSTKNANGLVISGSNITAQSVSPTMPGMLSTGADSIAGAKVWTGDQTIQKTNPVLNLDYGSSAGAIKFLGPSALVSGFQFDNSYNFLAYTAGNGTANPFLSSTQSTNFVGIKKVTATSTLDVNGSIATAIVAKTANYTLTAADQTVVVTSGSNTQTLPTAVSITGREYTIKNTGAGTVTVATTSSQTIDGAAPGTLAQGAGITVMSDGANWVRKDNPTGTGLTNPMTTIGDIIQGTTAGAPARLASVATGNAFISGGVGTASSWGKIGLTTHVSGTLPVGNGGLGVATTPTNGTIPIGNGTNYVNASITGTANRITVTPGSGTITLSGPQDLATTSTPQFARMGIGTAATAPYGIYINGTDIIPFAINGTSAPGVGATAVGADIAPTFTENSSGTHAEISSMRITAPTVTNAAAAVTNSYTLHVGDNPVTTGANNIALQVDGSSRFVKGISYGSTATITDGATVTFDCSAYSIAKVTLGGNRTLAISNAVAGQSFTLELIQDGTGSRTITLPGTCKVANGGAGAVTLTTTAGAIDVFTFWYDGTSYFVNYGKNYN